MYFPSEMLKCVGFVLARTGKDEYRVGGTVFMVQVPFKEVSEARHVYAVTAKHVVNGAAYDSIDGQVYLRFNLKDEGGAGVVRSDPSSWYFHPTDEAIDVAVCPGAPTDFDVRTWSADRVLMTEEEFEEWKIGFGTEICFPGLFARKPGIDRNLPVLRSGTIAAMPAEAVTTKLGAAPMYLIEARSIGGFSGAPLFAPVVRDMHEVSVWLLGVVAGHFEDNVGGVDVHSGIALATPAAALREVLDQDDLVDLRASEEVRYAEQVLRPESR